MKKILLVLMLVAPVNLLADTQADTSADATIMVKKVTSPEHRVALLELYTSEGCSSCPPADLFLTKLRKKGISEEKLIPIAFHVTYWDYIGWKDRFANKKYDQRQRDRAAKNKERTVYTPQFVLAGDDYRSHSSFNKDINKIISQPATVSLILSTKKNITDNINQLHLELHSDISKFIEKNVGLYFAVIENNLSSNVSNGENKGETLHHDYVVRKLLGPFIHNGLDKKSVNNPQLTQKIIRLEDDWDKENLSVVAFAENLQTGEVLQAVRLGY